MKVVIPGPTGQIGTALGRAFRAQGDEVVVLSRGAQDLLLKSRRVGRLLESGFVFQFPTWAIAAPDL